jgi:ribosomal protein L16
VVILVDFASIFLQQQSAFTYSGRGTGQAKASGIMIGLRQAFSRLSCGCSVRPSLAGASPSSSTSALRRSLPNAFPSIPAATPASVRFRSQLAPRRTKYRKAHKGRVPVPTGGSLKGTTIQEGEYGIRLLASARLSAKQLQSAETALKRKLKVVKGAQVFMRVFPDIPVCVKGNETRMGKGKGSFEFWACRAPVGRVIFEIGGPVEIRQEVAREGECTQVQQQSIERRMLRVFFLVSQLYV